MDLTTAVNIPCSCVRGVTGGGASQAVMVVNEHSFKFNCSLTWTNCSAHTEILRHSKGDFFSPSRRQ